MENEDDEDADGASIKGSLGIVNKSQQKDPKVQALQNYVIEKLNEEICIDFHEKALNRPYK